MSVNKIKIFLLLFLFFSVINLNSDELSKDFNKDKSYDISIGGGGNHSITIIPYSFVFLKLAQTTIYTFAQDFHVLIPFGYTYYVFEYGTDNGEESFKWIYAYEIYNISIGYECRWRFNYHKTIK